MARAALPRGQGRLLCSHATIRKKSVLERKTRTQILRREGVWWAVRLEWGQPRRSE